MPGNGKAPASGRDVESHVSGETRPRSGQGGGEKPLGAGAKGVIMKSEKGDARKRRVKGDSQTCDLSKWPNAGQTEIVGGWG